MRPDNRTTQFRKIERLHARNMFACTVNLARRYLAAYPRDGLVWLYYAKSLRSMARYSEALSALRRATRWWPSARLAWVYNEFGRLYQARGAFRRAERWFRLAVEQRPSDASHYIYLGGLLAIAGRLEEAEAVHRQGARCKEGCIDEALLNLGLVLRALERYSDARRCFQRALAIDPKYKDARQELSDIEGVIEQIRNA